MADRYTEFNLLYRLIDLTAAKDSTVEMVGDKYSDADSLIAREEFPRYMTLEHNFSILDGTADEFPTDLSATPIGFFGISKSSTIGAITDTQKIIITMTEYHSSAALTFFFADDFPNKILVKWYRDGSLLSSKYGYVNSLTYVLDNPIQLYNELEITFISTHIPDRYIKCTGIMFGKDISWDETVVKSGTLVQDMDRISDKLSIDNLSFEIIDDTESLNFGNNNGLHNYFQRKQELLPSEIVDDTVIPLGKFYLDTYSYELNLGKMSAISFVGLMDGIMFIDGDIYNGTPAGVVIRKIFAACEFEDFVIDEITEAQPLYGTIAPTTCRNALNQVLFACQSILDSTESQTNIKICKPSSEQKYIISRNTKISTKMTKQPYVSGVNIQYSEYTLSQEVSEISKEIYEPGVHKIVFSAPYTDVSISNGTIIDNSHIYYVIFSTTNRETEVTITGTQYQVKNNQITINRPYINPGEIENVVKYNTNLCNQASAKVLAKTLLAYHMEQLLELDIQHIASDTHMNDLRHVQNQTPGFDNYLGTFINRTFDLTGGFIDNAKLRAYFNLQDYYYYTGTELYSGNNTLL